MIDYTPAENLPAFILVRPQLAENVGTAARAMMNCALSDMRLVAPKADWLSERAVAASSGASEILKNAKVFDTIPQAVADLKKVYATTGRVRDMVKPVFTGQGAAADIAGLMRLNGKSGVLFGPERTGLENDEVAYADAIVEIPLNPKHCSLNLAQAVLLVGYEVFKTQIDAADERLETGNSEMANKDETEHLFMHLEQALDSAGYFKVPEKKPRMVRNMRNVLMRTRMTSQEIRTLHGIVEDLLRKYQA